MSKKRRQHSAELKTRVALEAEAQNLGMTQLLTQAVTTAIKKDMIEKILREPSPDPAPQAVPESP